MKTLNDMAPGETCNILKLTARGHLGQRLLDLGFFPGVRVKVIRNAPLVDPVDLELEDGYHVSIRHEEARSIEVNLA